MVRALTHTERGRQTVVEDEWEFWHVISQVVPNAETIISRSTSPLAFQCGNCSLTQAWDVRDWMKHAWPSLSLAGWTLRLQHQG